jgi:hypothetical protein
MFNDPPDAGKQFFMVAVSATYSGPASDQLDSSYNFRAVGSSNVTYTTFNDSCGVLPDPSLQLHDPEVFTGGTVTGNAACWSIATGDAASLVLLVRDSGHPDTWFALH